MTLLCEATGTVRIRFPMVPTVKKFFPAPDVCAEVPFTAPELAPAVIGPSAPRPAAMVILAPLAGVVAFIIVEVGFPPATASAWRFSSEVISVESTAIKEGKSAKRAERL